MYDLTSNEWIHKMSFVIKDNDMLDKHNEIRGQD